MRVIAAAILSLLGMVAVACGSNPPLPTYTPLATHTPAATYTPLPTYTPLATHTPIATYTPLLTHTPLSTPLHSHTHHSLPEMNWKSSCCSGS